MRILVFIPLAAAFMLAGGCVVAPSSPQVVSVSPPGPLVAYPLQGQSPDQTARDQYDCHTWAAAQTGYDPSQGQPTLVYQPGPIDPAPGADVAAGALTGAFVGAATSSPWHAGQGALVGAIAGGLIGAVVEGSTNAARQAAQDQAQANPPLPPGARDYRRAMSACLQGRGYSVH